MVTKTLSPTFIKQMNDYSNPKPVFEIPGLERIDQPPTLDLSDGPSNNLQFLISYHRLKLHLLLELEECMGKRCKLK